MKITTIIPADPGWSITRDGQHPGAQERVIAWALVGEAVVPVFVNQLGRTETATDAEAYRLVYLGRLI